MQIETLKLLDGWCSVQFISEIVPWTISCAVTELICSIVPFGVVVWYLWTFVHVSVYPLLLGRYWYLFMYLYTRRRWIIMDFCTCMCLCVVVHVSVWVSSFSPDGYLYMYVFVCSRTCICMRVVVQSYWISVHASICALSSVHRFQAGRSRLPKRMVVQCGSLLSSVQWWNCTMVHSCLVKREDIALWYALYLWKVVTLHYGILSSGENGGYCSTVHCHLVRMDDTAVLYTLVFWTGMILYYGTLLSCESGWCCSIVHCYLLQRDHSAVR